VSSLAIATELALYLHPDGDRHPLGEPTVGWPALLDLADEHQLLPALWSALVQAGVRPLPAGLRRRAPQAPLAVLEDAYVDNAARVGDLLAQGLALLDALRDAEVPALPIKGLQGLLAGWWRDPTARVMVDIDVLVAADRVENAVGAAQSLGYRDLGTEDPEGLAEHQLPALGLSGHLGSVELHTAPLVRRRAALLPAADLFAEARPLGTVPPRAAPSPTHAVVLAIAHAQLQDDGARLIRLPLRALSDVASMQATGALSDVDWEEVRQRFARVRATPALAGFAAAFATLFGSALPLPHRGGREWLRAACWARDHREVARRYREVVSMPRALDPARMHRLYGARTVPEVWSARARHVLAGTSRRVTGRPVR
jgi:Uncharacterised nucleotidyltransferase